MESTITWCGAKMVICSPSGILEDTLIKRKRGRNEEEGEGRSEEGQGGRLNL